MNRLFIAMLLVCRIAFASIAQDAGNYVIAYVTSWSDVMPDPMTMTHINYAFGHVNDTFDGIRIDNQDRLKAIVSLRESNPDLKILLSVGGWGSGRFSEMVSSDQKRHDFCKGAQRVIAEFDLDGIDIDWEYPGSPGGGISYSANDKDNFSQLMHDLREAIGDDKLLTIATFAGGEFYAFPDFIDDVDFVNMMTYDMASAPGHHAPLFNSELFGGNSCDKSVKAHISQGVPPEKLCLGLPFYGRGVKGASNFVNYKDIESVKYSKKLRDAAAGVPYLVDSDGNVILGYDDAESLKLKCEYAKKQNLAGVMYWDYAGDDDSGTLRNAVKDAMAPKSNVHVLSEDVDHRVELKWFPRFRALVVYNPTVEPAHRQFAQNAIDYFKDMSVGDGMIFKYTSDFDDFNYDYLRTFDMIISLDDNPGHTKAQREAFEKYMENGGAWLGFHAAGFNIESTNWDWFLQFFGGGQFYRNNWPPLPAKINIDDRNHEITKGMPESYIAPANEWYQWKPSPRENPDVRVIASLSTENYPIGLKDEIPDGDTPVVWSNTRYNMVYMNFGHGPLNFSEATQNYLISNAIRWLMREKYKSL